MSDWLVDENGGQYAEVHPEEYFDAVLDAYVEGGNDLVEAYIATLFQPERGSLIDFLIQRLDDEWACPLDSDEHRWLSSLLDRLDVTY